MEWEFVGYVRLAANVIGRARSDALHGDGDRQMSGRAFFTTSSSSLSFWASVAGLSPDVLRDTFRRQAQRAERVQAARRDLRLEQRRQRRRKTA